MPAPRIPSHILDIRGAFRAHPERARPDEPAPDGEVGDPPERLDEQEKLAWRTIVEESIDGVLCKSDRLAVEMAARLLAESWETGREFDRAKRTELRHYLTSLGMTPADRSRVSVGRQKPDKPKVGLASFRR